ncbi:FecR domain-containing protein [Caulobacter sp. RHG1]|uniref:FecR family protein n=1 Tax=Caulobacter sp. (strain RHG1) TaxID=2545762 RepID=UPI0015516EAB|nr:FecR domain-containing protein [Caulobacter sp. RHG1]NQE60738.1 hypothetical protein [Caulobacter sp. RHG1]
MTATPALDPVHREAAVEWFIRLQGEPEVEDWTAFQAWLEADERHRLAYDEVEATWLDLDETDETPAAEPAPQTVVPFRKPSRRPPAWTWGVAALTAAAAVVTLAVLPTLTAPQTQTFTTAKGEVRDITLADGSRLSLSSDTRLEVRLARKQRDVVLARGEASFDVARDESRPFTVQAGDRDVRVLGTEFNILRSDQTLAVTVRRGVVRVSDAGQADVHQLTYGDQLLHRVGESRSTVRKVQPDRAFAWKKGRLTYENAPLSEVVADLNRYVPTPIRVDPGAIQVKVSGVLLIDKEAAMLRHLELFAPVTAENTGTEIVLKARAPSY